MGAFCPHAEHGKGIRNRRTDQPNGTGAQAPVTGGRSRSWESPQGVFGEDRNHAGTERDQRFGHRHKGVEAGRSGDEPSGEEPNRPDEAPTGTGSPQVIPTPTGVEKAHGETGLGCQVSGLLRRRAGGQNGRPGSHRGPVDESGPGTEVDGLSGIRIRVMPLGAEPGVRNEEAAPRS